jgi:hypothetical protein
VADDLPTSGVSSSGRSTPTEMLSVNVHTQKDRVRMRNTAHDGQPSFPMWLRPDHGMTDDNAEPGGRFMLT